MKWSTFSVIVIVLGLAQAARADDPSLPRPVPLTRPEMKRLLEDMKARKPRIPLPELTSDDIATLGEDGLGYERRLRHHYTPGGDGWAGNSGRGRSGTAGASRSGTNQPREQDPKATLDDTFRTQLFWIVCRTNNCQYCQGHQESHLARNGLTEESIAALDGDWLVFNPAEQAAFAFARKVTYEPHRIADADIDRLRNHFTDLQILEMLMSLARNNSTNRWKEGVGVPQSPDRGILRGEELVAATAGGAVNATYDTPTPDALSSTVTLVAPLEIDEKTGSPTRLAVCRRPALESREEVEEALAACRQRTPRLPLLEEGDARAVLPADWPAEALPQWVRLLAHFPLDGKNRIISQRAVEETGDLPPVLKAQASWIIARHDRAWYAAGRAKHRLLELGQTEDQIYSLDGTWDEFSPGDRALFKLAKKLAASPVVLTDNDVTEALKESGPREVVQMIVYTTHQASFDRITEAAGLRLEN